MNHLNILMRLIAECFRRLKKQRPEPQVFTEGIFRSNVFEGDDRPFIDCGINRWLAEDDLSAMHVLVPTLERVLRGAARKTGLPTIRLRRDGNEQASLDTVLKTLEPMLDPSLMLHLRLILTDPAGWALRHNIAHGLGRAEMCNPVTMAGVIHLLLWLGTLRGVSG